MCRKLSFKILCCAFCFKVIFYLKLDAFSNELLLFLVTRLLPRNGGMAEDHGAPEAGQLPRVWTRGRRETQSRQRVSGAKSPWLDSAE